MEDKCFENESINVGTIPFLGYNVVLDFAEISDKIKAENAGIASAIASISNAEIGIDFSIICDNYD